ncbi:MAG: hypothetical protein WAP52_01410 [Candidatus Sungiibacteriota bacterium]
MIPSWAGEIKEIVRKMIGSCALVYSCREGDEGVLIQFMLQYYPFVKAFPDCIAAGQRRFRQELVPAIRHLDGMSNGMFRSVYRSIRDEEREHHNLWVKDSEGLEIMPFDLNAQETQPLISKITELASSGDPITWLLRLVAVEMIAQTFSELCREDARFMVAIDQGWFLAHVGHEDEESLTHEQTLWVFATAVCGETLKRQTAEQVIISFTRLFIAVGDVCVATAAETVIYA